MVTLELCDLETYRNEVAKCLDSGVATAPRADVRTLVDAFDELLRRYHIALTQIVTLTDKHSVLEAIAREVVAWYATKKSFYFELDALRVLIERSSRAMDDSPELPKRNSTAPAGPFVLVNLEELEMEINDFYTTAVEDLAEVRTHYRSSRLYGDVSRITSMINAYTDMKNKALAAIRRAAGGVR